MAQKKALPKPLLRLWQSITIGNLWLSVLSLAAKGKIYAYNLPDAIKTRFGFSPSLLLVYLVLYRLESDGFLKSAEDGRRRYYSITPAGRAALAEAKTMLIKRAGSL